MNLTAEGKERLDRFVARKIPDQSRSKVAQAIKDGLVAVGHEVVTKPSFELSPGDHVTVADLPESSPHDLTPFDFPLDVRYEDDDLLVVNKPRGMVSHPGHGTGNQTLVNALLARSHSLSTEGGEWRPGIVHRLDKETTGLMIVAKNDATHRSLSEQIKRKSAIRIYLAHAFGDFEKHRFVVNAPIGRHQGIPSMMTVKRAGREAVTHFVVLPPLTALGSSESEKDSGTRIGTLLGCRLETGRTHQIRVHLSSIGHPVKGDSVYAKKPWSEGPMQLHAAFVSFTHPVTGTRVSVYAEAPADFDRGSEVTRATVESCL